MPEAAVVETPVAESLGWRAGLPDDLKTNEAFVPFKTVGDFAKHHLEVSTKAKDFEKKLGDYVPKLPDNATDDDKAHYYNALGRPEKASEYEFDGEDKNAPEWTNFWKTEFHGLGLTKTQAKALSTKFNGQIQRLVEASTAQRQQELKDSEQKLRSEYGDKFETNVELAKRLYRDKLGNEFDKDFDQGTSTNRFNMVRYLVKLAAMTGEDRSPQAGSGPGGSKAVSFISYDKSPAPPKKN